MKGVEDCSDSSCCLGRPVPIPTLDEYILLSRALQAAAAQDEAAVAGLRGARASLVSACLPSVDLSC